VKSLSEFENIQGRLTVRYSAAGYQIIADTYNANPLSVTVAIDVLADMQGDTCLLLCDMAEFDEHADKLPIECGS